MGSFIAVIGSQVWMELFMRYTMLDFYLLAGETFASDIRKTSFGITHGMKQCWLNNLHGQAIGQQNAESRNIYFLYDTDRLIFF